MDTSLGIMRLCYVASTVLGPGSLGVSRDKYTLTFMSLGVQKCMCMCVRLLACRLFINKTKHAVNIFKLGDFTFKSRFLASLWNIRKPGSEISLHKPIWWSRALTDPRTVPASACKCPLASPMKRKLPLGTGDERPGGIREPRQGGHRCRAQSGSWEGAGDLAVTLFHRHYLSLSSAHFVLLVTENPEGEFWFQLALCTANLFGAPRRLEKTITSPAVAVGLARLLFLPRGQNPWKGSYLFWS